jgi:hypothetical protein
MSFSTALNNLRVNRKVQNEKINAGQTVPSRNTSIYRMLGIPSFALAFVFALMSMCPPASAGALNDSVGPILSDVASLFAPLLTLIIAAIPVIVAIAIISFILGILAAILLKLKI